MELTEEQKKEIAWGVESEGFAYYFCDYTCKWEETPSEIQKLVKRFTKAKADLEDIIESWDINVDE